LVRTDILICSTGLLPSSFLGIRCEVMKERKHRPVFLIDISVPRNIDPEINKIDNVYLYNVDDLQEVIETNILERKKKPRRLKLSSTRKSRNLAHWAPRSILSCHRRSQAKADDIKREEIERFRNRSPISTKTKWKQSKNLANSITNKLMHNPTLLSGRAQKTGR